MKMLEPVRKTYCAGLPRQTITPASPFGPHLRSQTRNHSVNGCQFWSTAWYFDLRPIEFSLNVYCRCPVRLTLVMRTCLPCRSPLDILVNGDAVDHIGPSDDNWFTMEITLPGESLEPGTNHITLATPTFERTPLDVPPGIWVRSAGVGW